jgi:serine protease Do
MGTLEEVQRAAAVAADRVGPAVVAVGRGAGVVVAPDAVLTNAHNVQPGAVPVGFADGRRSEGEVLAADVDDDLAVVRVATEGATPVTWAEAGPRLGAAVFALGAPRAGAPGRVTVGFVSDLERPFRGPRGRRLLGVEHTAPRGRGSSGGPIVDSAGRVVGIDTHRHGGGFYLALPAGEELRRRVETLVRGETRTRRRIGVAIASPEVARRLREAVGLDPREGLLVRELDDDGPAAAAGLRRGDLLVAADDVPITSSDELLDQLDRAGDELRLRVVRGSEELDLTVRFPAST